MYSSTDSLLYDKTTFCKFPITSRVVTDRSLKLNNIFSIVFGKLYKYKWGFKDATFALRYVVFTAVRSSLNSSGHALRSEGAGAVSTAIASILSARAPT